MPSSNRDAILKKKIKNKTTNIFCHLDALDVNICNVTRILSHFGVLFSWRWTKLRKTDKIHFTQVNCHRLKSP